MGDLVYHCLRSCWNGGTDKGPRWSCLARHYCSWLYFPDSEMATTKKFIFIARYLYFLAVAAPWYFKMYQLHGSTFIDTFLGLHNYVRATISRTPDDNVFYYYLVLFSH